MANAKIIDLDELLAPADTDVLPISDVSETETKKVKAETLREWFVTSGSASAQSITGRAPNAEGGSTSFARADHVHQIALAVTNAGASPHALSATTGVLLVDTALQVDVALPDPATVTALLPVLIIDQTGGAAAKPIKLLRAGAEKIDGVAATKDLAVDFGRWWLWTDGVDWYTAPCLPVDVAKLAGIEAGADVTDAANVATAGALMADGSAAMTGPLDMGAGNDVYNANAFDGVYLRLEEGADQAAEANHVNVYAKDVAGASALHARTDDGAIHLLTGRDQLTSTKTSAHTVGAADDGRVILIDSSGGSFDLDLPDPTTLRAGFVTRIVDVGGALVANPVTLDRFGAETIGGVAQDFMFRADFGEWVLRRNGPNWLISGRNRCRQVFTSSGTLVVAANATVIDLVGRPGAGGGGGGGGGGAGASADLGGGGGGRVAGGGGGAVSIPVRGIAVTPGESLDVAVGAGGTGGAGGAPGAAGGAGNKGNNSRVDRSGTTTLVRWSSSLLAFGGGQASGAGSAGNPGGATGGAGQTAVSAGQGYHSDFTGNGGPGGTSGAGGTGNQAGATGNNGVSTTGGLLIHNHANKAGGGAAAGGATDGVRGGGGGGAGGGYGGGGDDLGAYGETAATAADGAGGAGGVGGAAGDPTGTAGSDGGAGTNGVAGRGGGAGGGGGGGGAGATTGGAGGSGGAGGNGSDGIVVVEWWG